MSRESSLPGIYYMNPVKNIAQRFWANLQWQANTWSLILHLSVVAIYFIATYEPPYENIDFDMSSDFTGFGQKKKRAVKKVSIVDLEKKEIVQAPTEEVVEDTSDSSNDSESDSEIDSAEDLAFNPDAIAPRPIGGLRKIYPEAARQREIEAVAYVSVVISRDGKVLKVTVLGVRLSKQESAEIDKQLKGEFANAAKEILSSARFTPAIIKGNRTPIAMEMPLNFTLN